MFALLLAAKNKAAAAAASTATNEALQAAPSTNAGDLNINFNNPTWDTFVIIFFVIGALLYGLSLGRDRIIALLVSIYMALAVVNTLPQFVLDVRFNNQFTFQITAFVSIFVILFFLLSRSALTNWGPGEQGSFFQVILYSILHVGLLLSVSMSFLPENLLANFSSTMRQIFTGEWQRFGWIIAPIIAMIFFGRAEKK